MGLLCIILIVWGLVRSGSGSEVPNGKNVSYDGRSLIIDGKRQLLFSGSIHYPRSPPQMWPHLISKAKAGGLDVIQTCVFWNIHEPQPGHFDFSGRHDLVRFIKEVHSHGLYVCLRIGPFIEAEWTYGGLPFWLHDVPGIVFRTDNEPFKKEMQRYAEMIVGMMKKEKLYASQGGPIILTQIENEYGTYEAAFEEKGTSYLHWAAKMAVNLETGVPWIMCKQDDAPDPVINTCNGMRCGETFAGPNSPHKPSIWTENWTSFYQTYGEEALVRSAEDIAYHTALFIIAKKGCYVNYYMYHGGTNFGRTAAHYMITGYYDQAPLDEYGLPREPKWSHLEELHAAIKLCKKPLLHGTLTKSSLGELQEAYVYKEKDSGECAAFLVNKHKIHSATVIFNNSSYFLPRESISILPDCNTVALNTAQVNAQYSTRSMKTRQKLSSSNQWETYSEPIPVFEETKLRADHLLEQMNTTKDSSDYLWYTFRFEQESAPSQSVLKVGSRAHVLHAFVNKEFIGSAHGNSKTANFTLEKRFGSTIGVNYISLLSGMVGLPDSGTFLEKQVSGLRRVMVQNQKFDRHPSGYQVGLVGERLKVYSTTGSGDARWNHYSSSDHQPLTWYKTNFDSPRGHEPVVLNLGTMGKGEAWVNGQSIGRYWVSFLTTENNPSQQWYNVPREFLKDSGENLLVLLEEEAEADPLGISIDTVSTAKVCGQVSDSYSLPVSSWEQVREVGEGGEGRMPEVKVSCREGQGRAISRVVFASYGNPLGDCWNPGGMGSCHSPDSESVVRKACVGKRDCSISLSPMEFGEDPCPGTPKSLLVVAQCD